MSKTDPVLAGHADGRIMIIHRHASERMWRLAGFSELSDPSTQVRVPALDPLGFERRVDPVLAEGMACSQPAAARLRQTELKLERLALRCSRRTRGNLIRAVRDLVELTPQDALEWMLVAVDSGNYDATVGIGRRVAAEYGIDGPAVERTVLRLVRILRDLTPQAEPESAALVARFLRSALLMALRLVTAAVAATRTAGSGRPRGRPRPLTGGRFIAQPRLIRGPDDLPSAPHPNPGLRRWHVALC